MGPRPSDGRRRRVLFWPALLPALLSAACGTGRYAVLASTATNIGVEIAQSPANQAPQAKLGYQRTELAIVPTNRPDVDRADPASPPTLTGADQVADVVMELRYGGIFDWGPSSGIYQRLAVGKTAVMQPGASLMFVRDADGKVSEEAARALRAVRGLPETAPDASALTNRILARYRVIKAADANSPDLTKFENAVRQAGYESLVDFGLRGPHGPLEKVQKVEAALRSQGIDF